MKSMPEHASALTFSLPSSQVSDTDSGSDSHDDNDSDGSEKEGHKEDRASQTLDLVDHPSHLSAKSHAGEPRMKGESVSERITLQDQNEDRNYIPPLMHWDDSQLESRLGATNMGGDAEPAVEHISQGYHHDGDEDAHCCVCLHKDSYEDDPIIFCEGHCGFAVHQECYHLAQVPEDAFICDGCEHASRNKFPPGALHTVQQEGRYAEAIKAPPILSYHLREMDC